MNLRTTRARRAAADLDDDRVLDGLARRWSYWGGRKASRALQRMTLANRLGLQRYYDKVPRGGIGAIPDDDES